MVSRLGSRITMTFAERKARRSGETCASGVGVLDTRDDGWRGGARSRHVGHRLRHVGNAGSEDGARPSRNGLLRNRDVLEAHSPVASGTSLPGFGRSIEKFIQRQNGSVVGVQTRLGSLHVPRDSRLLCLPSREYRSSFHPCLHHWRHLRYSAWWDDNDSGHRAITLDPQASSRCRYPVRKWLCHSVGSHGSCRRSVVREVAQWSPASCREWDMDRLPKGEWRDD